MAFNTHFQRDITNNTLTFSSENENLSPATITPSYLLSSSCKKSTNNGKKSTSNRFDVHSCQIKELTRALYNAQHEIHARDAIIEDLTADKQELLTRFRNAASINSSKRKNTTNKRSKSLEVDTIMKDLSDRFSEYACNMTRK